MKKLLSKNALMLGLILSGCISAAEKDTKGIQPVEIFDQKYVTAPESVSVLLQALDRGYPLVVAIVDEKEKGEETQTKTSENALLDNLQKNMTDNQAATIEAAKHIANWKELVGAAPLQAQKEAYTKGYERVLMFSPDNEQSFERCLKRSLPMLKARVLMRSSKEPYLNRVNQIDAVLAQERGDGTQVNASGIACGKYIGGFGFKVPEGASDEIKWLSALSHVTPNNREIVWKTFGLYGCAARSQPTRSPHFWQFAWKKLAFLVSFGGARGITLDDLLDTYIRSYSRVTKVHANEIRISIDPQQVRKAVQNDWMDAEKMLRSSATGESNEKK